MSKLQIRRGHMMVAAMAAMLIGSTGLLAISRMSFSLPAPIVEPVTEQEVASALARIGLLPDTLAAAGLTPAQTTSLVANARARLDTEIVDLRAADESFFDAKPTLDRLGRLVRNGTATDAQRASHEAAASTVNAAEAARTAVLGQLFNAAVLGLSDDTVTTITTIRDNRAKWQLPLQYLADRDRTEEEWVMLRDALANHRICAAEGVPTDMTCDSVVRSADADLQVSRAQTRLSSRRATVTAAWHSAAASE